MARVPASLLLLLGASILLLSCSPLCAQAQSGCSTSIAFRGENRVLSNCNSLGVQGASLAWSLEPSNNTLQVLFSGVATTSGGWVGWGINPGAAPAMAGTQAFIAFTASNGSTILTYDVTQATVGGTPLKCTPISLRVLDQQVEISGTSVLMFVVLDLGANHSTVLNHVWNRGPPVSNFQPGVHGSTTEDLSGLRSINMSSGIAGSSISPPNLLLKRRHGVLNTVGWGILLPLGAMAARYLKFTDPAWFYLHVFVQMSGYVIGVAGWATGLKLGNDSVGVIYKKHRSIGIALFAIATLQITAILLRPKKDHKIRRAWNYYHYALGVTILVLGIVNIFQGFDILQPEGKWRRAYVGVLIALGVLAVVFEVSTRAFQRMTRHHSDDQVKPHGATVGGAHGYGNGHTRQEV